MSEEDVSRPDPDALLAEVKKESRGRLKIFLGAAPGVGKTYEMLRSGRAAKRDGIDVVVGIVETHGRRETERLVSGLEVLPRKVFPYRGRTLPEMDLDALVERKPKLTLVDELAHTNAPGSRHAKRWQDGHSVIEARTGEQALAKAATEGPVLVVLDLGLPDLDGREVVAQLRDWFQGPILILSVRSSEAEKVAALDAGADDYVVKPFGVQELLARVRVLLRTRAPSEEPTSRLELGALTIDLAAREAKVDGRLVSLTRREFDLLALLARHAGKIVTQRQILAEIWGEAHVEDTQYLRVYVGQLRNKLGDDPGRPRFIRTESGVGYRLLVPDSSESSAH